MRLACLIFVALLPAVAHANESRYTDVDFDACQKLYEDEAGVALKCEGLKDYPVYA